MAAATEANGGENPLFEMERGEITEVAFLEKLTDSLEPLLGHRPEMHRFKEIYFEALQPNPPMIELMRELKADGYRMAMLTNNVREWEPLWRSMLPVDEIFETVVDSGFVGCRKPESKIYAITLERIGAAGRGLPLRRRRRGQLRRRPARGDDTPSTSATTSRRSPRSAQRSPGLSPAASCRSRRGPRCRARRPRPRAPSGAAARAGRGPAPARPPR